LHQTFVMNFEKYHYTSELIQERIQGLLENASGIEMRKALPRIFELMDLTTLEATDNEKSIEVFCQRALSYKKQGFAVAALCVYSPFVSQAKRLMEGQNIEIATVACGFPSGQMPLSLKLDEVRYAVASGADEVDMVISRGKFLQGEYQKIFDEISAVKEACNKAHLKVILETGELKTVDNIRKASEIALLAGADFLKTSTGKIKPAATLEAAMVMLDTISEFYNKTNRKVGFKPAGGIADPQTAFQYFKLVEEILGNSWLDKSLFRIGASRLADKLIEQINS